MEGSGQAQAARPPTAPRAVIDVTQRVNVQLWPEPLSSTSTRNEHVLSGWGEARLVIIVSPQPTGLYDHGAIDGPASGPSGDRPEPGTFAPGNDRHGRTVMPRV